MKTELAAPSGKRKGAAPHPEEMVARVKIDLGTSIRVRAAARATPAGIIATAILASSVIAASGFLVRMVAQRSR